MKKTWILIGALTLLTIILVVFALMGGGKKIPTLPFGGGPTPTPVSAGAGSSSSGSQSEVSQESPTPVVTPAGDTVTISTIPVNNFYQTTTPFDPQGDREIVDVPNAYTITYLAPFQQFLISITGAPFATYRQQAENAFLQKLGISQNDACKLNVVEGADRRTNPDEAGQNYLLSFCQGR